MQTLTYGVEIETIGLTRAALATAIQAVVGGAAAADGRGWAVTAADGRVWHVVPDGSLSDGDASGEIVTPILRWADLETLQAVVRAVRRAGARVDASCGLHCHVGAAPFDAAALIRLTKLVYQQEELIHAALKVQPHRLARYAKRVDPDFLARLAARRPRTLEALGEAWYDAPLARHERYHFSRYHGLNLHAVWYRGTIEFRWGEGTLHAGKVKAYVQLCLALAAKALRARAAGCAKRALEPATARYDFRVFLLRLGLIGEDFKTARHHLLANFAGSSAWKHTRPAPRNPARAPTRTPAAPAAG